MLGVHDRVRNVTWATAHARVRGERLRTVVGFALRARVHRQCVVTYKIFLIYKNLQLRHCMLNVVRRASKTVNIEDASVNSLLGNS
jgi:hypothetical protein